MRFFRRRRPTVSDPPRPRLGGPAEVWLSRGERTVASLQALPVSMPSGPTADRLDDVGSGAGQAVEQLRVLAGRVTLVETAIARIPSPQLTERRDRCRRELAAAAPDRQAELGRTLEEIDSQLAADARLRTTRQDLLTRMESAVLGLEGLLTRATEVSVAGAGIGADEPATGEITRLSDELEGLRSGLEETSRLTKGVFTPPTT
ncbi:MAG TPA: hypothetical protein VHC49_22015 [Mycobacteriales bacterium]|nr:hypothetical protein [Mycobacteriales bacterium]